MSTIPAGLRAELRDDYRRMMGAELTAAAIEEMAWEAACQDASGADEDDWQDECLWETGPAWGPHGDRPEAHDRDRRRGGR